MKNYRLLLLSLVFIIGSGVYNSAHSVVIPTKIFDAMQVGNASELSNYFNSSIELVILNNDDIYSRQHAEQMVRNFFSKNNPVSFTLLHQGGRDGAKYAIGKLDTNTKSFRIYFLVKDDSGSPLIHQLRIEEE